MQYATSQGVRGVTFIISLIVKTYLKGLIQDIHVHEVDQLLSADCIVKMLKMQAAEAKTPCKLTIFHIVMCLSHSVNFAFHLLCSMSH